MTIMLYNNASAVNAVNKELTHLASLTGTLREESSIIDPVITMAGIGEHLTSANYAYIEEFGRYYFINNVESVRNGLWRVSMHVDVLYTYAEQIILNDAIIERNENEYDLKLNDGLFQTQQNPRIAQYPFPGGFTNWNFVLAVAGN